MLTFTASTLFTPRDVISNAAMVVEHGRVVEVASCEFVPAPAKALFVDFGAHTIAPGYIDLHIHGAAGFDVMDDSPEALVAIERLLAGRGVTSYLPTTVTAPMDATLRALERLADAIEARAASRANALETGNAAEAGSSFPSSSLNSSFAGRARPLGIHLEGPFISHARRGVHPTEHLLPPKSEIFERLWQAARGHIRMMTIAPELDGALELIAYASARGVRVSLGHSDANFETTERAISAGAGHATHTFNAMRPLGHRDPGIVGAVLTDDRVTCDFIADGIHLDPAIVKLIATAKGAERTVLITDAISATGMPDGRYRLGSMEVDVKNGRCESGGRLAGSVLTMDRAVRNLAKFAGWGLRESVAAASANPAAVLGNPNNKGELRTGADADFVVLDQNGNVVRTFIRGQEALA